MRATFAAFNSITAPTLTLSAGNYGYDCIFIANSPKVGAGNLLYAPELYHDNGTLERPDQYKKLNGVLRWNPAYGGSGVNDSHFHPTQSRVFRLTYGVPI